MGEETIHCKGWDVLCTMMDQSDDPMHYNWTLPWGYVPNSNQFQIDQLFYYIVTVVMLLALSYYNAYIHLRLKHTVLGTHLSLSCLRQLVVKRKRRGCSGLKTLKLF